MGADSGATTRTNATSKLGRFGGYHYTNAEEPVCLILSSAEATNNVVSVGGGAGNWLPEGTHTPRATPDCPLLQVQNPRYKRHTFDGDGMVSSRAATLCCSLAGGAVIAGGRCSWALARVLGAGAGAVALPRCPPRSIASPAAGVQWWGPMAFNAIDGKHAGATFDAPRQPVWRQGDN
jgi:hypothetical protein